MERKQAFGGTVVASVTPLRDGGEALDTDAIPPLVEWLGSAEVDGILAMGTTGEGILLSVSERRAAAEAFVRAARGGVKVMVHCGAQTTRDTEELAAHAASVGADAVAVIGPPYFALDERSILAHFTAAARACQPLPFFIYEFADRAGYAVPPTLIEELRMRQPNLVGLKVSDTPWERFQPYLLDGLAIFVGPEVLIDRGLAAGAVGAVSALGAALPEVVVESVRHPSPESARRMGELRRSLQRFPFHAALKRLLGRRGLPVQEAVRRPLRTLDEDEHAGFEALVPELLAAVAAVRGAPAP
jgi:N-acetylneuraminate lyase